MEYTFIGKITGTHGINGEIKIKSNFKYKDSVFKEGNSLYLGNDKKKVLIVSYRVHKGYDMVVLKDYNSINDVIVFKRNDVFFLKQDIIDDVEYLNEDLINMEVIYNNKTLGVVTEVFDAGLGNEVMRINNTLIPLNKNFIKKIDLNNKKIDVENIEGLL